MTGVLNDVLLQEESSLRSVAEHDSEEAKTLWESEVRSRSHLGAQVSGFAVRC